LAADLYPTSTVAMWSCCARPGRISKEVKAAPQTSGLRDREEKGEEKEEEEPNLEFGAKLEFDLSCSQLHLSQPL